MLAENLSVQPNDQIEAMWEAACTGPIHEEITRMRRSYVQRQAVVTHEGDMWALEWIENENHAGVMAAYKVRPREVTNTVYKRIDE